jgi:hypothetical protein
VKKHDGIRSSKRESSESAAPPGKGAGTCKPSHTQTGLRRRRLARGHVLETLLGPTLLHDDPSRHSASALARTFLFIPPRPAFPECLIQELRDEVVGDSIPIIEYVGECLLQGVHYAFPWNPCVSDSVNERVVAGDPRNRCLWGPTIIGTESRVKPCRAGISVPGGQRPMTSGARPVASAPSAPNYAVPGAERYSGRSDRRAPTVARPLVRRR